MKKYAIGLALGAVLATGLTVNDTLAQTSVNQIHPVKDVKINDAFWKSQAPLFMYKP